MQTKLKPTKTQKTLSRIKILKILYTANSTVQAVEKQYNYMKGLVERLLNAWWTHWPNTQSSYLSLPEVSERKRTDVVFLILGHHREWDDRCWAILSVWAGTPLCQTKKIDSLRAQFICIKKPAASLTVEGSIPSIVKVDE